MFLLKKIVFTFVILSFVGVSQNIAQENEENVKKENFRYSPNPPAKISKKVTKKDQKTDIEIVESDSEDEPKSDGSRINVVAKGNNSVAQPNNEFENVSVATKTREVAKKASKTNLSPTEYYKVGVGDILYINLQNTTAKYFTVLMDGTIDYPLAGKLVTVLDLTVDEIEDLLRENIKLYENPQVVVKVREYSSHKISVEGLAKSGEYFLQREAMPLVVVKNMIGVDSNANRVVIEREKSEAKILNLKDSESDMFLIQKGDVLRFEKDETVNQPNIIEKFYFVGEKICSGGKKSFNNGITLMQAVFEVCGGLNDKVKDVSILRKTADGRFISQKYNIKNILKGDETDPILQPGDMIDEVK